MKQPGEAKCPKFRVDFLDDDGTAGYWEAEFNVFDRRCFNEVISIAGYEFCTKEESGHPVYQFQSPIKRKSFYRKIVFQYQGSIFSRLRDDRLPDVFYQFSDFMCSTESVGLLSPARLRSRSRGTKKILGSGGKYLASLLFSLNAEKRQVIVSQLQKVFPRLQSFDIKLRQGNYKQLIITESTRQGQVSLDASHVSDCMLRLLAIVALLQTNREVILFEELENGINPEMLGFLLSALRESGKQIITTTYSPLLLNLLEDEVAKKGLHLVYKRPDGCSRCVNFFSIPTMAEKLDVMGPGEVYMDTDLVWTAVCVESRG